jgi:hypothetical protein
VSSIGGNPTPATLHQRLETPLEETVPVPDRDARILAGDPRPSRSRPLWPPVIPVVPERDSLTSHLTEGRRFQGRSNSRVVLCAAGQACKPPQMSDSNSNAPEASGGLGDSRAWPPLNPDRAFARHAQDDGPFFFGPSSHIRSPDIHPPPATLLRSDGRSHFQAADTPAAPVPGRDIGSTSDPNGPGRGLWCRDHRDAMSAFPFGSFARPADFTVAFAPYHPRDGIPPVSTGPRSFPLLHPYALLIRSGHLRTSRSITSFGSRVRRNCNPAVRRSKVIPETIGAEIQRDITFYDATLDYCPCGRTIHLT